jgi:hypothetical protein
MVIAKAYFWEIPKEVSNPECLADSETRGWFCDGFGSILLQYSVGSIITLHGRIAAGGTWTGWVIRCITWFTHFRTAVQFSKTTVPIFTQLELFSHSSKNVKVNFSIFPGQHIHQVWTSLNCCGQFWTLQWGAHSHLQFHYSNLKIFSGKNGIKFR